MHKQAPCETTQLRAVAHTHTLSLDTNTCALGHANTRKPHTRANTSQMKSSAPCMKLQANMQQALQTNKHVMDCKQAAQSLQSLKIAQLMSNGSLSVSPSAQLLLVLPARILTTQERRHQLAPWWCQHGEHFLTLHLLDLKYLLVGGHYCFKCASLQSMKFGSSHFGSSTPVRSDLPDRKTLTLFIEASVSPQSCIPHILFLQITHLDNFAFGSKNIDVGTAENLAAEFASAHRP